MELFLFLFYCLTKILFISKVRGTNFFAFLCHFTAQQPVSGHYRGEGFAHPMLNTGFWYRISTRRSLGAE